VHHTDGLVTGRPQSLQKPQEGQPAHKTTRLFLRHMTEIGVTKDKMLVN